MRLILFTQKVDSNDSNLGFFVDWIKKISNHCSSLIIVCWFYSGESLPANTRVIPIKSKYFFGRVFEVLYIFIKHSRDYDKIFVHMISEVVVLLSIIKLVFKKDIYLWYTHKSVTVWLRLSLLVVKKVFTASKESFRLQSNKVEIVGHGINTESDAGYSEDLMKIITIGRVSRIKKIDALLKTVKALIEKGYNIDYKIIGPCIYSDDKKYLNELNEFIVVNKLQNNIKILSGVSHEKALGLIKESSVFLHQSDTGSLDKSPLEAMGRGLLVFSSSIAVVNVLAKVNDFFIFQVDDHISLFNKLIKVFEMDSTEIIKYRKDMSKHIETNYSLDKLINKIFTML